MKGLILLFFVFCLLNNIFAETVNKNDKNENDFSSTNGEVAEQETADAKDYYPFEKVYTVRLALGTIKLSLPEYYRRLKIPFGKDEPENNATFITGSIEKGKDIGANINIILIDLKNAPLCDTVEFQNKYLEKIKNVKQATFDKAGYKWIDNEYGALFGVPMLRTTYIHPKGKYCRDIMFVKFCRVYTIEFMADKDEFDKAWPIIKGCIKNIEFID